MRRLLCLVALVAACGAEEGLPGMWNEADSPGPLRLYSFTPEGAYSLENTIGLVDSGTWSAAGETLTLTSRCDGQVVTAPFMLAGDSLQLGAARYFRVRPKYIGIAPPCRAETR
jgi:hypothetical protein